MKLGEGWTSGAVGDRITHFRVDSVWHSQTDILAFGECVRRLRIRMRLSAFVWEFSQGCWMELRGWVVALVGSGHLWAQASWG